MKCIFSQFFEKENSLLKKNGQGKVCPFSKSEPKCFLITGGGLRCFVCPTSIGGENARFSVSHSFLDITKTSIILVIVCRFSSIHSKNCIDSDIV